MIMKTLGSACLLLEIHWQKGRQADKLCTCTHCLPTFLAAPSNFLSLPSTQFVKSKFHTWESTYPSSLSLQNTRYDKACEERQLGGTNMAPSMFLIFLTG
jgi:hypothetical protein